MKKICVVTGSRADYGLLSPLLKKLKASKEIQLSIVATGMHLSPEFGLTYQEIERDGFRIDERVEMLLSDDSEVAIAKSVGIGTIGFADVIRRIGPDCMVLLGDRFEALAVASAALICRVPIAHIHGGELTEGAVDDAIRHAITKMSYVHFTSAEPYRKRVIQLGEDPQRVFNTGALGLDNVKQLKLLGRKRLEKILDFKLKKINFLVTFHPVTLDGADSYRQFNNLLKALDFFDHAGIVFTIPNADAHGRSLVNLLKGYVKQNPTRTRLFTSLGQIGYLSVMKYVDVVIGNSSSGIIEAPSFGVPTVNVGDRQKGRLRSASVIDCRPTQKEIVLALEKALTAEFRNEARKAVNPYGRGDSAKRILEVLLSIPFQKKIPPKRFFDLPFEF